jgi:hypothetical protein
MSQNNINPNSITRHWNTNENYWITNPAMRTIKLFEDVYQKDKSSKKAQSSKLMWAIALCCDPHDSNPWKNTVEKEKRKLIAEDFLKDKKFNWEHKEIVELIEEYQNRVLTIAQKELVRYEKKLVERGDFISKTPYSMDSVDDKGRVIKGTADQLDKMVVNSGKVFEQLLNIKEKLIKESTEGTLRGGAAESAGETGQF